MKKIKKRSSMMIFLGIIFLIPLLMIFFAQPRRIYGDCMEPAIENGKLYFLNTASHYFRSYGIDDIILFNHEGNVWVSRIIALENDTIKINKNTLLINGADRDDSISRNWTSWRYGIYAIETPLQIPPNHVYVLSDNLSAHHFLKKNDLSDSIFFYKIRG